MACDFSINEYFNNKIISYPNPRFPNCHSILNLFNKVVEDNDEIDICAFSFVSVLINVFKINISLNMNNNFMLQNLIENGAATSINQHKMKKPSKAGNHELELLIGTIFNEACQMLEENNINIQIPQEVTKITEKANLLKYFIQSLVSGQVNNRQNVNQSGIISCRDCQNYEASLQKLEGQVRQHIRLEQQLKIFQDNQDEKLEEYKKEKKDFQKKLDSSKRQLEDMKNLNSTLNEKISKMQGQMESVKRQNRELKRSTSINEMPSTKRQSHKQSYAYQSKQNKNDNKIEWVHRNISVKKDEKDRPLERKSIEKRQESTEKGWRQSNTKSSKMISIMNEKLVHEKTKDERKKAIQSKFQYRR